VTRGDARVIADVEHRAPGEAMPAASMVQAFSGFGLGHSLDNMPARDRS
jgi:hypothetical protein